MDEQEFNRQYDKSRCDRAQHVLDQVMCQAYFDRLDATDLWMALVERMDERMNIAETEIDCILGIIADRLGRLEEIEKSWDD